MKKSAFIVGMGLALSIALGAGPSAASELKFGFNNPSFGGNPFIGQHLLNTATAINKHKEKKAPVSAGSPATDEADAFAATLNRLVLSRLARTIVDSAFGEAGLTPGKHVIGSNAIEVIDNDDGITVVLTDLISNTSTTVTVPHF